MVDLDMTYSWTTAVSKLHASLDFHIFRGAERKILIYYMQIVDTQCNINNIPVYQFFLWCRPIDVLIAKVGMIRQRLSQKDK